MNCLPHNFYKKKIHLNNKQIWESNSSCYFCTSQKLEDWVTMTWIHSTTFNWFVWRYSRFSQLQPKYAGSFRKMQKMQSINPMVSNWQKAYQVEIFKAIVQFCEQQFASLMYLRTCHLLDITMSMIWNGLFLKSEFKWILNL